ncbi:MAG: HlyD family efflux transporter periplasmic adaptor subunit [Candidatus Eiseniibacteriota bacterium]
MTPSDLFREEALREAARGREGEGAVLRNSDRWTRWTYHVLVVAFVAALGYGFFGSVDEYASGPAVVRTEGQIDLTARVAGTVDEVLVAPGDAVTAGQELVRFYAGAERSAADAARSDFEMQLVRVLRDPGDQAARAAAAAARPAMVEALARLEERIVAAPHDGRVQDLRIRPGQLLSAGDRVLTLSTEEGGLAVVAFLPGSYRPLLRPGLVMRLEVPGYSHAYVDAEIATVGEEVVGPGAVQRYLGTELGDAVSISGPVVFAHAPLVDPTFRAGGREHRFFPGMAAEAEVAVRREKLLVALVPGLRELLERGS